MKRKFTILAAAFALLAFLAIPVGMWGQTRTEVVAYTLDGTQTGGSNGYATESEITQDGITWMVTGNTTMNPWRIGGKNLNAVDRPLYSTNIITDNITKVVVGNGTSNIIVNSMTLIVSADANFSNPTSIITGVWEASSTTTFERPTDADWTNKYYKLVYNVTETSGSNKYAQFVNAVFYKEEGSAPAVATPTFNPASGTEFGNEGLQVSISCETEGVDLYYTLDGSEPDDESNPYNGPISLTETTTIKAVAYDGNENTSAVATATYTYVDPNAPGTENNPYTVAQARAAIDANAGTQGVYATGIVSAIPTAWSTQYNNITFNFVDNTGDTEFLQAYRCVSGTGVDASEVAVGDVVVVYGNLTKYQSTYEFAQGCTLVSLTHPTGYVEAPTFSPAAGTYDEAQNVTISCANANATIYYTLDGTEPTNASTPYTTAINIATTTTIKAIAYVGANASTVTTAEYTIVPIANISSITEVGTSYVVKGTVVATNSRGFVMGDGTGYVYYYKNGAVSRSIGDMVKVSGTTGTYGQIIQFTNTATVTEATTSNYNGTPAAMVITEVPDYTQGYHLSTYLEFEGALAKTSGNYLIALGDTQIQISYPTTGQGNALTALNGKNVHVKGYFAGINSSDKFTVMLESVEEVVSTEPVINANNITLAYDATSGEIEYTITNPVTGTVLNATTDAEWISNIVVGETSITFNVTENEGTEDRTATVTLTYAGAQNKEVTVTQEHFVV
ncbi:MAG: chitobiase/beta-hexosaminidase C-terminal domain-containing protein, partial [Prevotella sp.]|nr:chitobiase/beta-hexosaminidase C-terminal domain-containing protein [Prevotella sp.]